MSTVSESGDRDQSPLKYLSSRNKRSVLNSSCRKIILNVCAKIRLMNPLYSGTDAAKLAANFCVIRKSKFFALKKGFNEKGGVLKTPRKKRLNSQVKNRRTVIYDDFTKKAVRKVVHGLYRKGVPPTVKKNCMR